MSRENLSDLYKFPQNPMVNRRVDRLEDRIAAQERNLNAGLSAVHTLDVRSTYPSIVVNGAESPSSNDEKAGSSMPEITKIEMVAEDFRKYIGQIVRWSDSYDSRYVEVIEVVLDTVAIKTSPDGPAILVNPGYLRLF